MRSAEDSSWSRMDGRSRKSLSGLVDEQTIMIDHTFVSEGLRGQKIGDQLVKAVVDLARKEGKKIVPACSFALVQFKRHKDYQDVWQRGEKE